MCIFYKILEVSFDVNKAIYRNQLAHHYELRATIFDSWDTDDRLLTTKLMKSECFEVLSCLNWRWNQ